MLISKAGMSIWDRYASFVYRLATGNRKVKILVTPPAALLFFCLVALFVLASTWLDKGFPIFHFDLNSWSLVLSILLLFPGVFICALSAIAFLRARGTPVPFNPPPKLITTGLYAYVRNPMLLGLFIVLLGLGVLFGSLSLIFIFTPLFILVNILYLKAVEEKEMEKKFGRSYLDYKSQVPMFIPKIGGKKKFINAHKG